MSVTAPAGFRASGVAAGLKSTGAKDVALVVNDGSELGASGAVPRLSSLELCDGVTASVAERHVALGALRIFTPQRLDKRLLALSVRTTLESLRETAGRQHPLDLADDAVRRSDVLENGVAFDALKLVAGEG